MSDLYLLCDSSGPLGVYQTENELFCALEPLAQSFCDELFALCVPFSPGLSVMDGAVIVAPGSGSRRDSGGPAPGCPVTLSLNRNKKE
jgi:hypothetical protein